MTDGGLREWERERGRERERERGGKKEKAEMSDGA
jgi:hypothetical protein